MVTQATAAFEEFDYARAQEFTETFFWSFCDDYVELVKTRAYGEGEGGAAAAAAADSARATLALALSVATPAVRPVPPLRDRRGLAMVAARLGPPGAWPTVGEFEGAIAGDWSVLTVAAEVLGAVRRAKTTEKRSMRAKVRRLTVSGPARTSWLRSTRPGVISSMPGGVEELLLVGGDAVCLSRWSSPKRREVWR